eukprot:6211963-Pleurochrysis_carterae.AAC.4
MPLDIKQTEAPRLTSVPASLSLSVPAGLFLPPSLRAKKGASLLLAQRILSPSDVDHSQAKRTCTGL